MKVSEYILDFLAKQKTNQVFLITGGAIMFLIDSFKGRKNIKYICVQNEQAAAMAADAYSRLSDGIGTAMATSGPGATNLITGICCSWFDSIPALFITGQVNTTESARNTNLRQVGFQETDIVSLTKPVTKYSVYLKTANKVRYCLEKAIYLARSGRPGPVLIDIPMNIQKAEIDMKKLKGFTPSRKSTFLPKKYSLTSQKIKKVITLIKQARRPVIICGGGIRNAQAHDLLRQLAEICHIPVCLTFMGIDCLAASHPLHVGLFGTYGLRSANFTVANADLLLCLGTRLDVRQTGTSPQTFARNAKKVVVDIDPEELNKRIHADIAISCHANDFLKATLKKLQGINLKINSDWIKTVRIWKKKYPACLPKYADDGPLVNPYVFVKALSDSARESDIIIPDAGANLMWVMQTWELKKDQRLFSAGGMSPMGYSLPAAIGASFALGKKPVICTIGDGGLQINLQELQTIAYYKLPIKIFIVNNRCYGIIKQFQRTYLKSNFQATDAKSGYSVPDFQKLAQAYGLKSALIDSYKNLKTKIKKVLDAKVAVVCNVLINENSEIAPKLEVFHPIEDTLPYLPRKEFLDNMIVKPYADKKKR